MLTFPRPLLAFQAENEHHKRHSGARAGHRAPSHNKRVDNKCGRPGQGPGTVR